MRVDIFEPGHVYDVGTLLACVFVAEQWAEPIVDDLRGSAPHRPTAMPANRRPGLPAQ